MEKWLPPAGMTGSVLAFSFREGGSYRMRLTFEEPHATAGKTTQDADEVNVRFLRIVPGESIEQAVMFESADPQFAGEMQILWLFQPASAGTLVTVRCTNVPEGIRADDHRAGLTSTLENLADFVEGAAC